MACDLDELGFTLDANADTIRAFATDSESDAFGDSWQFQNVPSAGIDDDTAEQAIGIPEFSTLLMPIASVMLIVGNRIKNKKE